MTIDELPDYLRDAFYVTVGLGVIGVQNFQASQATTTRKLTEAVGEKLDEVRAALPTLQIPSVELSSLSGAIDRLNVRVEERTHQVDERINALEARVDALLDRFEGQLPESARDVVSQARGAAREARGQIRTIVTRAA